MIGRQIGIHVFTQIVNDPPPISVPVHLNQDANQMHIPLTRDEIAVFLELAPQQVDLLWRRRFLQRSLSCAHRPVAALSYSTVYDVLEYALAAGVLSVRLSKEVAALWVAQLAEADEWDQFAGQSMTRRIWMMMEMARDDGLADMTEAPVRVAREVLLTQARLVEICAVAREAI